MPHLTSELYTLLLDGKLPPRTLARMVYQHLFETCGACKEEWAAARATGLKSEGQPVERPLVATEAIGYSPDGRQLEGNARRLRRTRKEAQIDLWRLLQLPPERREERIINARTRFRSRAFAELVVEHCRKLVRADPREAAGLLELVPVALMWTRGWPDAGWMKALEVRAEAHRANALRVAGELTAAEELFIQVRRRLASVPVTETALYAEVASLEASLRWDQRRHEEAAGLLDQAVLIYQDVGEGDGLARTLIKRASIAQEHERHEEALADLERARGLLDSREQGFLYLMAVAAGASLLIDFERYAEAERVLVEAEEAFEEAAEPWWSLRLRGLLGRAALGRGDLDRAEEFLAEAREGLLDQGLPFDAAAASLHLAFVHLHQGRTADVRRLCREIAPIFRGLGIERDALATLRLFGQATAADAATTARLGELRRYLQSAQRSGAPGGGG